MRTAPIDANMDFDASNTIWQFFNQYSLTTSVTAVKPSILELSLLSQPASQTLSWQVNAHNAYTVAVYNSIGTEVIPRQHQYNKTGQIDINDLPKGIYFAVFSVNETLKTIKFIKA